MKYILTKHLFESENVKQTVTSGKIVKLKGDLTLETNTDILLSIFDNPWCNWYSLGYNEETHEIENIEAPRGYEQTRGLMGIWNKPEDIEELETFIRRHKVRMKKEGYSKSDIDELDEFRNIINPGFEEIPTKLTDEELKKSKTSILQFIENGGARERPHDYLNWKKKNVNKVTSETGEYDKDLKTLGRDTKTTLTKLNYDNQDNLIDILFPKYEKTKNVSAKFEKISDKDFITLFNKNLEYKFRHAYELYYDGKDSNGLVGIDQNEKKFLIEIINLVNNKNGDRWIKILNNQDLLLKTIIDSASNTLFNKYVQNNRDVKYKSKSDLEKINLQEYEKLVKGRFGYDRDCINLNLLQDGNLKDKLEKINSKYTSIRKSEYAKLR